MEPGIYGTDGTDPEEASGVLEPEDTLDGTRRRARRAGHRLVAARAAVGGRRLGDDGGRGVRGGEPRRPAGPRAARRRRRTRATAWATPPTPTASCSTTRWATCGPAGSWTPTTAGRPTTDDELWARDEGIDGAAASAEEAAVHIVRDRELTAARLQRIVPGRPGATSVGAPQPADRSPMGKPVLLSVDDDPGVSRAVARDLRRRYGEEFRVVRAESGDEALEALRELKLRGDAVAALLADYRMPQMNGIEFLEQAMDLFPRARRALLTAYADTDAAIQAINVVDLDYYLLKPWDPPEEKLYPVVDAMLEAWRDSRDSAGRGRQAGRAPLVGAVVPGARLPGPQRRARTAGTASTSPRGSGCSRRPGPARTTCRWSSPPTARCCARPTDAELAAVVGLSVDAARRTSTTWSSSAAARPGWARPSTAPRRGCAPCWSSARPPAGRPGRAAGSRTTSASPTASPARSWPTGRGGRRRKFGAEMLLTRDCVALEAHGAKRVLRFADGSAIAAHAVVLATGVSYRSLGVAGRGRPDRARRLLRLGDDRGGRVRRPGGLHRRRRELGRPGGGVLRPVRELGAHAGARAVAGGVDVALPDRAARRHRERARAHLHDGRRGARQPTTWSS